MGDVILFPGRERRVARSEERGSAVGAALLAAGADRREESRDRLNTAIALGLPREPGDGPLCEIVPIRNP